VKKTIQQGSKARFGNNTQALAATSLLKHQQANKKKISMHGGFYW
jgi:hypothetical protein